MIHFFAWERELIDQFIGGWADDLRPMIRTISYRRLPLLGSLPKGSCIFADYERARSWTMSQARKLSARLRADPEPRVVLNDPAAYVPRFELLKTLSARGINHFHVCRPGAAGGPPRFPVFLRSEVDHCGPITGLLHSHDDVERALRQLSFRNRLRRKHLMIVEYVHSAGHDGVFRKYSAMNIRGTLIPRHVLFSNNWVTKKPDLVTDATVEEEVAFLEQFPHRQQLAEIFNLAGVDYGRIDYGIRDGRIQVWEINTNPVLVPLRGILHPKRLPAQARSANAIANSLRALAG